MNRRRALLGAALAGAAGWAAWRFWPSEGLWNPCLATLPRRLAEHALVRAAWQGLDATRVWDAHAHLVGTGDAGSGITIDPRMESLFHPGEYARRLFFLNAGCVHDAPQSVDRAYVERMRNLLAGLPAGAKLMLYAFDAAYDASGAVRWDQTGIHVPNGYARDVARDHPAIFEWVASIHPYRPDCVEALATARREGARAVKWLPAAMGIDPLDARCDRFYAALAASGLPLISHAGLERAVIGSDRQDWGNPLRLRRALDAGIRVVIAHCASMGEDRDLDRGANGPFLPSFALFERLMDTPRYATLVYGDLSAMTQRNRAGPALVRVLEREDWHARLLNGSDYPLPGILPLYSVERIVELGLLDAAAMPVLLEIRAHNPLLFDFVLKRHLRAGARGFATSVFETRDFFARSEASRQAAANAVLS